MLLWRNKGNGPLMFSVSYVSMLVVDCKGMTLWVVPGLQGYRDDDKLTVITKDLYV